MQNSRFFKHQPLQYPHHQQPNIFLTNNYQRNQPPRNSQRYQNQNIKSMSTLPSKRYIEIISTPNKRHENIETEKSNMKYQHPSHQKINFRNCEKQLRQSTIYVNDHRSHQIKKQFYDKKKNELRKRSQFGIKRHQFYKTNNPQIKYQQIQMREGGGIRFIENQSKENGSNTSFEQSQKQRESLRMENVKLRSALLDYQLKQREQADELNKLQKLCIELQKMIKKQRMKNLKIKEEQEYLKVVKQTFMECFQLNNLPNIWTQQQLILKQWMVLQKQRSPQFSQIPNNQSAKKDPQQAKVKKQQIQIRINSPPGKFI